jgi:branched-chain amino acid transport system substrate-binding protein
VTFVNGTSAAQDTTLRDPAPNFFRFSTDGAQWMAGLGDYAFNAKKYKTVATVAEDYSFPYTQIFGFMAGFCKAGGHVPAKFWVPIGNKDFSSIIAAIPDKVDAIYVALGGADGVNFLTQYQQAGGTAPLIGGSITVDQTVLGTKGKQRDYVVGTPSAGPIADNSDDPAWKKFVADYKAAYKDGFPSPSLFAQGYYINTKAVLLALDKVGGDLTDKEVKFRDVLSKLEFDTPTGKVKLDKNRQAIADNYLTEVAKGPDGNLYNKVIKVMPAVNQTLGIPEAEFLKLGPVGRDNPDCK